MKAELQLEVGKFYKTNLQQALDALIESRDDVLACLHQHRRLPITGRYDKLVPVYEAQLIKHDAAIEGLKQALAQQEQPAQKPYAYEYGKDNGDGTYSVVIDKGSMREVSKNCWESGFPPKDPHKDHSVKPLYTHPAPTQPALSDEQIKSILMQAMQEGKLQWCGFEKDGDGKYTIPALSAHHYQIAHAIEAHLAPVQPALSEARWNYINSRAVDMSAAKYEALCSLLHAEVDATYDLGEAVDKAIEAHCRGGAK